MSMYLIVVGQVLNDSVEQEWRDGVQELDRGVAVKVARSLSILLILSTRQSHGKTKKYEGVRPNSRWNLLRIFMALVLVFHQGNSLNSSMVISLGRGAAGWTKMVYKWRRMESNYAKNLNPLGHLIKVDLIVVVVAEQAKEIFVIDLQDDMAHFVAILLILS